MRVSRACLRDACQPVGYPQEVKIRCGEDMAHVRVRETEVPAVPQVQHPDALRDRCLDACPSRVLRGIFGRLLAFMSRSEDEKGVFRVYRNGASLVALACTPMKT